MPSDRVIREKGSTPTGSATFVGLRTLDPFLQYGILARGLGAGIIAKLGSSTITSGAASATGIALLDSFGLSPYRLILLGMAVGSALKQNFWLLITSYEVMPASTSIPIAVFNTVCNSTNSLLFTCAATSAAKYSGEGSPASGWPPVTLIVGSTLYVGGILIETISEIQRKSFKSKLENSDTPHTSGLFSWARHINYTGYTMWRGGYALASAGWIWGSLVFGLFAFDFIKRGVPVIDEYCHERYARKWDDYKKRTPYKLFPYIY